MKIQMMMITGMVMVTSGVSLCLAEEDYDTPVATAPAASTAPAESTVAATKSVYACSHCNTMGLQAGKCAACGMALVDKHVLGVKDGKVQMCACAAGCKCDAAGVKDGKCACAKPVQEMSAKGMYVCACEGSKCCNTVSDKPGKCACGTEMKKAE